MLYLFNQETLKQHYSYNQQNQQAKSITQFRTQRLSVQITIHTHAMELLQFTTENLKKRKAQANNKQMFFFITSLNYKKKWDFKDLNNRHLTTKHENHAHLQEHSEGISNVIRAEFFETLSTVAALQKKSISKSSLPQPLLKLAGLAGENDGREGFESFEDRLKGSFVRVFRNLGGFL